MKSWHLYIIECKDGTYYTGITTDLERRISEHKEKRGAKYTRARGFKKLLYTESLKNISVALKREIQIKKWSKEKKKALIDNNIVLLKKLSH